MFNTFKIQCNLNNNKILTMRPSIIICWIFFVVSNYSFSQELISIKNASTCESAIEISTLTKFGPTTPPKEEKLISSKNPFDRPQYPSWYKFTIERDGVLLFDIIPIDQQDNYDFILYKITTDNYCANITNGKLEPVASNMFRNDPSNNGMTGLSNGGTPDSYSKGIEVLKGEKYLLALNNMYKGKGHTVVFKYLENFKVTGSITDAETNGKVKAEVFWTNLRTKETSSSEITDKDGAFQLKVSVNTEVHRFPEYLLWAFAKDYYIADTIIASKDVQNLEKKPFNLKMFKLKKGNSNFLPKILFEPNDQQFTPESMRNLERIQRLLQQNPNLEIVLEGHSNGFYPSTEVDKDLSEGRAEVVRKWLIDNGIESTRLSSRGFGSEKMLYPMAQDEFEESMNRRVEIFISKM